MDWMSPSWLVRERSWGKREMKGRRNHGYNRVEKWVGEVRVDEGREEEKGGEYQYSRSNVSVIIVKRRVSSY